MEGWKFIKNLYSEVYVNTTYDNSLGECLIDNNCLGDILSLVECLLGVCSETAGTFNSNLNVVILYTI